MWWRVTLALVAAVLWVYSLPELIVFVLLGYWRMSLVLLVVLVICVVAMAKLVADL